MSVDRLRYRDSTGNKTVAVTGLSNSFTEPQVISVNTTGSAALRINQLGTYYALLVEDETYPDATAFVIDANGRVGIGSLPDATAALNIDAGGIKFNDGTVQTTAFIEGDIGLDELQDVQIDNGTLTNNNIIAYSALDGVWQNKSINDAGGIQNVQTDASVVKTIRMITSTDYDALVVKDTNTIYFII